MIIPLALLIVLGLVAWRLVRGVSEPAEPVTPAAVVAPEAKGAEAEGAAKIAEDVASASPPVSEASAPSAPSSAAAERVVPVATPTAAPLPPGAGSSMRAGNGEPAAGAAAGAAGSGEGLRDKTGGWGRAIINQLNKELMPLASECIDQAVARNPKLEGTLALDLVVVPTDAKKAIVESVTPSAYNQIKDDELVECLRQSSFAMEGLGAPYNFTLSMPIKPATKAK